MLIGKLRHFTSTRSPFHKTFFDQERFIHFLNSARIFAQSGSNGCQTDRTAFKLVYDGTKYLVVYLVAHGTVGQAGDQLCTTGRQL